MISASKSTLSINNLKILTPKVTKNLMNLRETFCESPPRLVRIPLWCINLVYIITKVSYELKHVRFKFLQLCIFWSEAKPIKEILKILKYS